MSNVPIQNPPSDLSMKDVLGMMNQYGGLAKSCRYIIRIIPQGEYIATGRNVTFAKQFTYLCEASEMPGRQFMNIDARYYGPNFKLPYQTVYEDTTMTFLCRTQSYERQFFDDWMEVINPTNLWDFNYRDTYRSEIQIYQLADYSAKLANDDNKPNSYTTTTAPMATYQWTLHDAYPIVINPQPVTWADDNFQRLSVSFTYTKWTRRGLDATPKSFAGSDGSGFIKGSQVVGLPITKKL